MYIVLLNMRNRVMNNVENGTVLYPEEFIVITVEFFFSHFLRWSGTESTITEVTIGLLYSAG
jgi:hypothetical protein